MDENFLGGKLNRALIRCCWSIAGARQLTRHARTLGNVECNTQKGGDVPQRSVSQQGRV